MSRLTQNIRERICNRAITAAFKEREESRAAAEIALGMEAYQAAFPEKERVAAAAMPEGWLRLDRCLRFNANGWNVTLRVNPGVPVPSAEYGCRNLASLTGELADRVQRHAQDEENLRDERRKAERELSGFLDQFKTIKQMREAWPEGEPFYAEFDVDRKPTGVPAVRVAEINALLGIQQAA